MSRNERGSDVERAESVPESDAFRVVSLTDIKHNTLPSFCPL